ncbi:hypothetical protein BN903_47 [Halorubrum sp. AJ67]|nr:hypothetical protein BN903_47 [Halorubrum sp. AJ67]
MGEESQFLILSTPQVFTGANGSRGQPMTIRIDERSGVGGRLVRAGVPTGQEGEIDG